MILAYAIAIAIVKNLALSFAKGGLTALQSGRDDDRGVWPPLREIWHVYQRVR